jgi:PPOX class probable F420-dependent enzyme
MPAEIPEDYRDLLEKPVVVSLASLMPDGQPQVNPVWCSFDGDHVFVNSAKGRQKDRNMRARDQVTLLAMDPANPYRYVEVRGKVVNITEDGADDHIDDLAEAYLNQRPYPFRQEGEVRVIYQIEPVRVHTYG